MAGEWLLVTQFITAAAMFALAGWLLWLKFSSPVNRSFALFLVVRGMISLINALLRLVEDEAWIGAMLNVREYYFLAISPILVYFLLVYIRGARTWDLWRVSVALVGIAMLVAFMVDHCLSVCDPTGESIDLGPLALFSFGVPFMYGAVAVVLAWRVKHDRGSAVGGEFVVAVAFMLLALLESALALGLFARAGLGLILDSYEPGPWVLPAHLLLVGGLAPGAAALALLSRGHTRPLTQRFFVAAMAAGALVTGGLLGFLANVAGDSAFALFVVSLWRLVLPALVAYGLIYHRIFDAHVRVRRVARRGTVVAFFASAYFVFSEGAAEFFADRAASPYIGIAAAALLLFALAPMQRVADRIVAVAMPERRAIARLPHQDRVDLYRDQADLVWRDGSMGARERLLLDQLRDRLHLSLEEASDLERRAAEAYARSNTKSLNAAVP